VTYLRPIQNYTLSPEVGLESKNELGRIIDFDDVVVVKSGQRWAAIGLGIFELKGDVPLETRQWRLLCDCSVRYLWRNGVAYWKDPVL